MDPVDNASNIVGENGGNYLRPTALVEVKNGKYKITFKNTSVDSMPLVAFLKGEYVVNDSGRETLYRYAYKVGTKNNIKGFDLSKTNLDNECIDKFKKGMISENDKYWTYYKRS